MQVMIGTIEAEVSEDGREVHLPPPATAKDALALQVLQAEAGHATKPSVDLTRWTTSGSQANAPVTPTPQIEFDGRLGASLIVCLVIVGIAASRVFKKGRAQTMRPEPTAAMDEAAFLKRYGGRVR